MNMVKETDIESSQSFLKSILKQYDKILYIGDNLNIDAK